MTRLSLATQSAKGRSVPLTAEKLVNMYAEQAPSGAKSDVWVLGCPGLTLFGDVSEKIRGMHVTPADGKLYVVAAQTLYSVASTGVATSLGTISGYGRVGMDDNGTQLCIVTGARGYTYSVLDGLETISDRDFPGADTVTFIDGFFVFNNRSNGEKGQFFISSLLDGQTYDALDFATAERYPDNLVRVFADHSELLLFGDESIEVWFNAGNADFPFSRAQGSVIEQGLGARWTVEKVDESVIWLDNEGMVRRLQGNTPVRISTHAIEHAISKGDWTNATAYSYTMEGHQFYCLTVPAATLTQTAGTYCFDAATGLWHERKSYENDYSRVGFGVYAFGKHIVGDIDNGYLYEMSLDVYDENGEAIVSEMIFPQIQNDGDRFIVNRFQLDAEVAPPSLSREPRADFGFGSWTQRSSAFGSSNIFESRYGDGAYIAIGASGKASRSLDNGNTWTSISTGMGSSSLRGILFFDGEFIISGFDGKRATSTDKGDTWTVTDTGSNNYTHTAYNGVLWVSVGENGVLETSEDFTTWTPRSHSFGTNNISWVDYGNGRWVIVGEGGLINTSTDGITWSSVTSPFGSGGINAVVYKEERWVAAANGGEIGISDDGVTWDLVSDSSFGSSDISEMDYGGGLWIAGGEGGKIASSPDGETWTQVDDSSFAGTRIYGLSYGNGTFVAVGGSGKLATISGVISAHTLSSSVDPQVMLDVSGNTRTFDMTQGWRSMGKKGEYDTRVIWRRLGQFRSFTPKISISSPVRRAIFSAYADITPSR